MTAKELTVAIAKAISEKKGEDILMIHVEAKTTLCSYMVIATAGNMSQVKAIAENVEEKIEKQFELSPTRIDGKTEGRWSVIDYGDVIVHIFERETREFYRLERLWQENCEVETYTD